MTTKLLTAEDLAEWFGVPVRTIDAWRHRHKGPPFIYLGRHARYREADVEDWIANGGTGRKGVER